MVRITWLAVTSSRNRAWGQQAVSARHSPATVAIMLGVRRQGEPDRPAGMFYRGRCGGHLLPLADPGSESVGVQRAAPGLGAGSGPIGIKLKVGLAAASPSALFWAGVAC